MNNPFVTRRVFGKSTINKAPVTIVAGVVALGTDLAVRGKDSLLGRGYTAVTTRKSVGAAMAPRIVDAAAAAKRSAKTAAVASIIDQALAQAMAEATQIAAS